MQNKIATFRRHVEQESSNPEFVHHRWFFKWHLEVVQKIAAELCEYYPEADKDLVELMAWLHDYGKILDFDNRYDKTLTAGRQKLIELEFTAEFIDRAIDYVEVLDKKLEVDLRQAPIEAQIVSTADGCSHMVGPFLNIFWNEATDTTFAGKSFEELMALNLAKIEKSWKYKVVLPEARKAFESRYQFLREQAGELPDRLFQH
jgi:hypothetical protein